MGLRFFVVIVLVLQLKQEGIQKEEFRSTRQETRASGMGSDWSGIANAAQRSKQPYAIQFANPIKQQRCSYPHLCFRNMHQLSSTWD